MNQRQAKRDACFRAACCLENALAEGWLMDDDPKLSEAMHDFIAELKRRGWAPAPTAPSPAADDEAP